MMTYPEYEAMPPIGNHMISYWRGHGILGAYSLLDMRFAVQLNWEPLPSSLADSNNKSHRECEMRLTSCSLRKPVSTNRH